MSVREITRVLVDPSSDQFTAREQKWAWLVTVILGTLTVGVAQAVCGIIRTYLKVNEPNRTHRLIRDKFCQIIHLPVSQNNLSPTPPNNSPDPRLVQSSQASVSAHPTEQPTHLAEQPPVSHPPEQPQFALTKDQEKEVNRITGLILPYLDYANHIGEEEDKTKTNSIVCQRSNQIQTKIIFFSNNAQYGHVAAYLSFNKEFGCILPPRLVQSGKEVDFTQNISLFDSIFVVHRNTQRSLPLDFSLNLN